MRQFLVNIAKSIYLHTPFRFLREIYYRTFCYLIRGHATRANIEGINYHLDLGESIDLCIYLNRYEPEVTAFIVENCHEGYTVLDIGANIGAHSLLLAKRAGPTGKVFAFEPTDYAYNKLKRNICLNSFSNIIPVQIALSDRTSKNQRICYQSSWPTKGKPKLMENVVDFVKLDDWCETSGIDDVNLIKMDVDGNEYSVISGGYELLTRRGPLLLMEVWGPNFADPSRNPFELLKQIGYRFFNMSDGVEYKTIAEMKANVSIGDKLLDRSYSVVAKR